MDNMPCSCDGITCSCGIPCFCPGSTCGCTDCDNSTDRLCSLCNQPILYTGIIEKVCLCFRDHQTAKSKNIEPDKSSIMHEGYILMYDYILNDWVPVIVQHSNLSPPTFQMVWICHQQQDYELLGINGHKDFVEISNPIGGGISHNVVYGNDPTIDMTYEPLEYVYNPTGGISHNVVYGNDPTIDMTYGPLEDNVYKPTGGISYNVDYGNDPTIDMTYEPLEDVNNPTGGISHNVPLNVDSINEPVGAVGITDESFEENIYHSTGSIWSSESLDVKSTSESLETENTTNSIYTAGIKMHTLIEPDLRERNIVKDWLDSFKLD